MDKMSKKDRNRLLLQYIKGRRGILLLGVFFALLNVFGDMVTPRLVGNMLDRFYYQGVGREVLSQLIPMIILYFVVMVVNAIIRYYNNLTFQKGANAVTQDIREDVFAYIQRFPISYFDSLPVGSVVSRITNDTKHLQSLFQMVLWQLTMIIIYLVGVYVALFLMNPKLALIALLPWPMFIYFIWNYKKRSGYLRREIRHRLSGINAQIHESVVGMKIIQAFTVEEQAYEEFEEENQKWLEYNHRFDRVFATSSFNLIGLLKGLALGGLIYYFGYGMLTDAYSVSPGAFYILVNYGNIIFNQVQALMNNIGHMERALSAADHIFELLNRDVPLMSEEGEAPEGDVNFNQIGFSYVEGEKVLKDISFTVQEGKTMAFVGATGSGKSSLMNLLFRFYDPQEGQITIGGQDTSEVSPRVLRKNMGIVLQDPYLFTGTLYSNIGLGNEKISRETAKNALIAVGGGHLLEREHGLDVSRDGKGPPIPQENGS